MCGQRMCEHGALCALPRSSLLGVSDPRVACSQGAQFGQEVLAWSGTAGARHALGVSSVWGAPGGVRRLCGYGCEASGGLRLPCACCAGGEPGLDVLQQGVWRGLCAAVRCLGGGRQHVCCGRPGGCLHAAVGCLGGRAARVVAGI